MPCFGCLINTWYRNRLNSSCLKHKGKTFPMGYSISKWCNCPDSIKGCENKCAQSISADVFDSSAFLASSWSSKISWPLSDSPKWNEGKCWETVTPPHNLSIMWNVPISIGSCFICKNKKMKVHFLLYEILLGKNVRVACVSVFDGDKIMVVRRIRMALYLARANHTTVQTNV